MKALVVYESMFGNTKVIAESIGRGLSETAEVALAEVGTADYDRLQGIDLLVIGGPTHAWSLSRPITRRSAADQGKQAGKTIVSQGIGIREWLKELPVHDDGLAAAVFDTSAERKGWMPTGSAARAAAPRLTEKGLWLVVNPEQFFIAGMTGPLEDGEVERAAEWGRELADRMKAKGQSAA